MYDVKQFKPVLYLLILLGITGFAMAAESAGLWVFATAVLLVNGWLISRDQFKPLPQVVAVIISLASGIYAMMQVTGHVGSPIIAVGQWLVVLQLVYTWKHQDNRDYAVLLVLSLLLMVAAAISTASLLFGLLFITFLFLALYCCLLFHLKVETDEAKKSLGLVDVPVTVPADVDLSTLRLDQKHLTRSMRRLTGLVAVYSVVAAVAVFLLFPRGTGAGMFGQFQWRPRAMTGFSEQVSFQTVAKIEQNNESVATVKVWKDGVVQTYHEPLLLRGVTHDYYNGKDTALCAAFQWGHSTPPRLEPRYQDMNDDAGTFRPKSVQRAQKVPFREEIQLTPTGTQVVFSLPGPVAVKLLDGGNLRRVMLEYADGDQAMRTKELPIQPVKYEVQSTGDLGNRPTFNHEPSQIDPRITAFARLPEVAGPGLIAARDADLAAHPGRGIIYASPYDEPIARNFENYLRTNYQYTLDLTDTQQIKGRDPMVAFLFDFKKGHCEYFAGAMTLMCQSLGMDARLVVGFKCDDFNDYGQYYDVKQSQAHAWVEVRTAAGWKSFDPTGGSRDAVKTASAWQKSKQFLDFLEYTWQNSVIAYNSESRDGLIQSVDNGLSQTANQAGQWGRIPDVLSAVGDWLANRIVGPLVALLAAVWIGVLVWFTYDRFKLRRRARRIGVDVLPAQDQVKMLRQLGFYDDLIRLLERHQIVRPPHLTPLEFSNSLSFIPGQSYDTIRRLTLLFYKIRYGSAELDEGQKRRLSRVVGNLTVE